MDIFKLREMTSRQMTNDERGQVSGFMSNLVDNIRDTLKEKKGLGDKIVSITEKISATCPTDLGVRVEFTLERKSRTIKVVLDLVPSAQKINFLSYDPEDMDAKPERHEFRLTIEGSRKASLKAFDIIDFVDCFAEKKTA